jgi:hypothetical protein
MTTMKIQHYQDSFLSTDLNSRVFQPKRQEKGSGLFVLLAAAILLIFVWATAWAEGGFQP